MAGEDPDATRAMPMQIYVPEIEGYAGEVEKCLSSLRLDESPAWRKPPKDLWIGI